MAKGLSSTKKGLYFTDDDGVGKIIVIPEGEVVEHFDGSIEALSDYGREWVEENNLNREDLVQERHYRNIDREFYRERQGDELEPYESFRRGIDRIDGTMRSTRARRSSAGHQSFIHGLLYTNVITVLETYLKDKLIGAIQSDRKILKNFVKCFTQEGFKEKKFTRQDVFEVFDSIEDDSIEGIRKTNFHNLRAVIGIYRGTFGIEFPDFGKLFKLILVRHDLVHRNGLRDADGNIAEIETKDVEHLCSEATRFIEHVENEISL